MPADTRWFTRRRRLPCPPKATPEQRQDLLAYLSSLGGIEAGPVSGPVPLVSQADRDTVMRPRNGEWPTYNGLLNGNRYSSLDQINTSNVQQLQPQFTFSPGGTGLEVTPVVVGGVMYVTGAAQTCAINARTGSSIWCTPRTNGLGRERPRMRKTNRKCRQRKGLIVGWQFWETASSMYQTTRSWFV